LCRAQYREDYGSSEVLSRMFTCELCSRQVKHTRSVVGEEFHFLFGLLLFGFSDPDAIVSMDPYPG
jgi:hypothetical protein